MADWTHALLSALAGLVPGWGEPPPATLNGYVEADYVYAAPAEAGRIVAIDVAEGDDDRRGRPLFRLDRPGADGGPGRRRGARRRGRGQSRRPPDRQPRGRDRCAARLARRAPRQSARWRRRRSTGRRRCSSASSCRPPRSTRTARACKSSTPSSPSCRPSCRSPNCRPARRRVTAARAALRAAEGEADRARSALADRIVSSPSSGLVERLYFEVGEVASAGAPVAAILPEGGRTAIVFVPEPQRATLSLGQQLALSCDGCPGGATATITHIESDPQYTPPLIYSRDERQRLVFRTEAAIDGASLLPGQPVTLTLP